MHVSETGFGIPAEALPGLFQGFYQVDRGEGRRRGGSGLGLVIARGLVAAMGGSVSVASTVGEGSRFSFTLPRARPAGRRPPARG